MLGIPPEIAVYPVQHLPIIKAYADQLGLVSLINHYVSTEMDMDAGTIVLGLVLDTLSGRSPLYRLALQRHLIHSRMCVWRRTDEPHTVPDTPSILRAGRPPATCLSRPPGLSARGARLVRAPRRRLLHRYWHDQRQVESHAA